ncbi:MAG: hypothetical protein DRN29_05210 [Thermoplasmata archaeon]|nr:MAG: hypothetical protein DRN29_05210 [Thermoplasmata archaeon]
MKERKKIVIGHLGEVGRAIAVIFKADYGIDKNRFDELMQGIPLSEMDKSWQEFEWDKYECVVHICIPFMKNYVGIVVDYMKKIKPVLTLIHTTCKVGTTRKIYEATDMPVVHCPINGRHPNMVKDIMTYKMFVGAIIEEHGQRACEYIEWHGLNTYLCETPEITELSKIASTELIRVNIEFYQKMKRKIRRLGLNWAEYIAFMQEIVEKGKTYNRVYQRAGKIDTKFSGKHCISKNKKLLEELDE